MQSLEAQKSLTKIYVARFGSLALSGPNPEDNANELGLEKIFKIRDVDISEMFLKNLEKIVGLGPGVFKSKTKIYVAKKS